MEGDEALFEIMRTQMGLDPADCDEAMLNSLREKFSGRSKKPVESKKKKLDEGKQKKATRDEKLSKFADRVK